jgi:hypothetical protein
LIEFQKNAAPRFFECTSPSDSPSLWVVFSIHDDEVSFWGIFHDQRNAEKHSARITGARVERVALCDTKTARFDAAALIG